MAYPPISPYAHKPFNVTGNYPSKVSLYLKPFLYDLRYIVDLLIIEIFCPFVVLPLYVFLLVYLLQLSSAFQLLKIITPFNFDRTR